MRKSKKFRDDGILMLRVIENRKYPVGKIVTCDTLMYPSISDKDFDSIDKEQWKWETREFPYPLFGKKKKGEVFLIKLETTHNYSHIGIHEDTVLLEKAKQAFINHDEWWKIKWEELGKKMEESGFFSNKIEGPIEL